MRTKSFKSVVQNYRAVFFDAFGVLKNHSGLIPGIEQTFAYLEKKGIPYYILTNDSSRSPDELARWYQDRGMLNITTDKNSFVGGDVGYGVFLKPNWQTVK